MEFEARLPRLGELRRADVRAVLGDVYETAKTINVLVLGRPGQLPSTGVVRLGSTCSGRGQQRLLICPKCAHGKRTLHVDGTGGFGCGDCIRKRTRHQSEKHRIDYSELGGREEDQLLRLLQRCIAPRKLERAHRLAEELVHGDVARVAALEPKVRAALALAGVGGR